MSKMSDTETAILGLLYEHHHYAYRLEKIIEKRRMRSWADIDFSSIYYILKRLEEKNLVESRKRNIQGKSSRRVYSITDEGRKEFQEKIKELLRERDRDIFSINLGFANMSILSQEELIQSLKTYLKSIDERIEFLDDSIKIQEENNIPYNFIAIFSRSSALLKAEKRWTEEFIEKIKEKKI